MRELMVAVLLAAAVAGCAYMLVAVNVVRTFAKSRAKDNSSWPALTVLKPLHGDEPELFENLLSLCRQDYPGAVQIVFGVADANDPAIGIVERLRAACPDRSIELVIEPRTAAGNPKVANLLNMSPRIAHEVVVIADSDIRAGQGYLRQVVSALLSQPNGAVTCPYYGIAAEEIWPELVRLAIDSHFLPGVVVAAKFRLARPCLGSTIVLRRSSLSAIGGFQAIADELADDYALGEALARRREAVRLAPFAVGHVCRETSFAQLWRHELRWAQTIRTIDPVGYGGYVVSHAFPLALIAVALGGGLWALAASVVALGCRAALLAAVARGFDLPSHRYWLIPARDLLSFAVFVAGFFGRDVSWQDRRYRLKPEGTLRRSSSP
jgi:ceramide glucosyltransferase